MSLPIWQELLVGVEVFYLRISPVYYGVGIPRGDGSAVVAIPAFLGTDHYLDDFRGWLKRIGYRPYASCIGWNAECPNLLISLHLGATIEKAYKASGRRKVHLIGHSLGGVIARAAAAQMPDRVASVISLGGPFRGIAVHPWVRRAIELVRKRIVEEHYGDCTPACYTPACTCDFLGSLRTDVPDTVHQTAIYTRQDGIVDWRCCRTGNVAVDLEVSATHLGLPFNPIVYEAVARRLSAARAFGRGARGGRRNRRAA